MTEVIGVPGAASGASPHGGETAGRRARRVLIVGADPALFGLLEEWLVADGCTVADEPRAAGQGCDIVIVDIPFPRHSGLDVLKRLADEHPGTPVLALSSNFFSGVEHSGSVARSIGVACALPKPVPREMLLAAVRGVLRRTA